MSNITLYPPTHDYSGPAEIVAVQGSDREAGWRKLGYTEERPLGKYVSTRLTPEQVVQYQQEQSLQTTASIQQPQPTTPVVNIQTFISDGKIDVLKAKEAGVPDTEILNAGVEQKVIDEANEAIAIQKEVAVLTPYTESGLVNVLAAVEGGVDDSVFEAAGISQESVLGAKQILATTVKLDTGERVAKEGSEGIQGFDDLTTEQQARLQVLGVEGYNAWVVPKTAEEAEAVVTETPKATFSRPAQSDAELAKMTDMKAVKARLQEADRLEVSNTGREIFQSWKDEGFIPQEAMFLGVHDPYVSRPDLRNIQWVMSPEAYYQGMAAASVASMVNIAGSVNAYAAVQEEANNTGISIREVAQNARDAVKGVLAANTETGEITVDVARLVEDVGAEEAKKVLVLSDTLTQLDARDAVGAVTAFIGDNIKLETGEYVPKDSFNNLDLEYQEKLNKLGIDKFGSYITGLEYITNVINEHGQEISNLAQTASPEEIKQLESKYSDYIKKTPVFFQRLMNKPPTTLDLAGLIESGLNLGKAEAWKDITEGIKQSVQVGEKQKILTELKTDLGKMGYLNINEIVDNLAETLVKRDDIFRRLNPYVEEREIAVNSQGEIGDQAAGLIGSMANLFGAWDPKTTAETKKVEIPNIGQAVHDGVVTEEELVEIGYDPEAVDEAVVVQGIGWKKWVPGYEIHKTWRFSDTGEKILGVSIVAADVALMAIPAAGFASKVGTSALKRNAAQYATQMARARDALKAGRAIEATEYAVEASRIISTSGLKAAKNALRVEQRQVAASIVKAQEAGNITKVAKLKNDWKLLNNRIKAIDEAIPLEIHPIQGGAPPIIVGKPIGPTKLERAKTLTGGGLFTLEETASAPFKVVGSLIKRPEDMAAILKDVAKGMYEPILHPIQTARGLKVVVTGEVPLGDPFLFHMGRLTATKTGIPAEALFDEPGTLTVTQRVIMPDRESMLRTAQEVIKMYSSAPNVRAFTVPTRHGFLQKFKVPAFIRHSGESMGMHTTPYVPSFKGRIVMTEKPVYFQPTASTKLVGGSTVGEVGTRPGAVWLPGRRPTVVGRPEKLAAGEITAPYRTIGVGEVEVEQAVAGGTKFVSLDKPVAVTRVKGQRFEVIPTGIDTEPVVNIPIKDYIKMKTEGIWDKMSRIMSAKSPTMKPVTQEFANETFAFETGWDEALNLDGSWKFLRTPSRRAGGYIRTRVDAIPIDFERNIIYLGHAHADQAPKGVYSAFGGGVHYTPPGVRGGAGIEALQPRGISITYGTGPRGSAAQQMKEESGFVIAPENLDYLGFYNGQVKTFSLPGNRVYVANVTGQTLDPRRYALRGVRRMPEHMTHEIDDAIGWNGKDGIMVYPGTYDELAALAAKYPKLKIDMSKVEIYTGAAHQRPPGVGFARGQASMNELLAVRDVGFAGRIQAGIMVTEDDIARIAANRLTSRQEVSNVVLEGVRPEPFKIRKALLAHAKRTYQGVSNLMANETGGIRNLYKAALKGRGQQLIDQIARSMTPHEAWVFRAGYDEYVRNILMRSGSLWSAGRILPFLDSISVTGGVSLVPPAIPGTSELVTSIDTETVEISNRMVDQLDSTTPEMSRALATELESIGISIPASEIAAAIRASIPAAVGASVSISSIPVSESMAVAIGTIISSASGVPYEEIIRSIVPVVESSIPPEISQISDIAASESIHEISRTLPRTETKVPPAESRIPAKVEPGISEPARIPPGKEYEPGRILPYEERAPSRIPPSEERIPFDEERTPPVEERTPPAEERIPPAEERIPPRIVSGERTPTKVPPRTSLDTRITLRGEQIERVLPRTELVRQIPRGEPGRTPTPTPGPYYRIDEKPHAYPVPPPRWEKEEEEKREKVPDGSIGWPQGFGWWVLIPPFRSTDAKFFYGKEPPRGALEYDGPASAIAAIQGLGGTLPSWDEKTLDLGIVDIEISRKGRKLTAKYKADPGQKTKSDVTLGGLDYGGKGKG